MSKPPKVKHRHGRRQCIFCEQQSKMSKEHIFGKWLAEYFPRDAFSQHMAAHVYWPKKIITRAPVDKRRNEPGHSGSRKLRVVCQDCNNGWLSQLEEWASKALPPMIAGERCNLLPAGQTKLATWAVKTAMVASEFKPRPVTIAQDERTLLMNELHPPQNWFVWIAAYRGTDWAQLAIGQIRADLSPTPIAEPDLAPYYIQATTFGLGHLLVSVVGGSYPSMTDIFAGKDIADALQIWPTHPRSILWPPATYLDDEGATVLANIIKNSGAFDHSLDPGADWTFTL